MSNVYTLTPNQTKQAIQVAMLANTPVLVCGSAGIGKSTIVKQLAEDNNLELIDIRLGQLTRYDLLGFPDVNSNPDRSFYKPLDIFPTDKDSLPQGKDGWLLFADELLQADKYVQGALYKIILDRKVGEYNLHPNVVIVAAANGSLHSTADNKMIAPLKSRFTHIEMVCDTNEFKSFTENNVFTGKWNPIILGFINFKPEHVNNYDVNNINDVQTYSCPRSIEMLAKQINAGLLQLPEEIYKPAIIGIIGEYAGNDFIDFLALYGALPTIQEIETNPQGASMPTELGSQWALSSLLLQGITPNNVKQFAEYIERVNHDDVKVVIYRTLLRKCPALMREPLVQKSMGILKAKMKQVNFGNTP